MITLSEVHAQLQPHLHPIVPFDKEKDKVVQLDLSGHNTDLTPDIFRDTDVFTAYIHHLLRQSDARYGIGGYLEDRQVYARSAVFDAALPHQAPRTLHLGVDIWGPAGTPVMAPLEGIVHSTGNHVAYGNYGATIILQHQLNGYTFYTLYGHLSTADLHIQPGQTVTAGGVFAHFGPPAENGHWPPHLHFQVMYDMQGYKGDYPGVCAVHDREFFAANCPDPGLLLTFGQ